MGTVKTPLSTTSQPLPAWLKNKPQNFDGLLFKERLASLSYLLTGFLEAGRLDDIRHNILPHAMKVVVSSETFAGWLPQSRRDFVSDILDILWFFEKLEVAMQGIGDEDATFIEAFINSLLISQTIQSHV